MAKRAIPLPTVVMALLLVGAAAPAPPARPGGPAAFTVEPTLALTIDLSFEGVDRGRGGSSGRLRLDLGVVDEVADLALVLRAPDGLTLDGPATQQFSTLHRGEARALVVPFHAAPGRDRDLRVEATFRTADGMTRTLGQGITLAATEPPAPGHRHLDAYECQAVPLSELRR